MIRFRLSAEPADFEQRCRRRGAQWLAEHPGAARPRDFWSKFRPQLCDAFHSLCAYTAIHEPIGTVDHFLSFKNHPEKAYEWSNYRYCSAWMNSKKGTRDDAILDPFEVEDGWFEVILPSMQMVGTENIPPALRAKAKSTLEKLDLRDGEQAIRLRRAWYEMYQKGELTLTGLRKVAPLVAQAVESQID